NVSILAESINVKKNKLALGLLEIPIEFRYRTLPDGKGNSFKVAVGFKGGYQFTNKTKYVGDDIFFNTAEETKIKVFRYEALNTFRYGPTFRVGYGAVNLQAFYGLSEIFQEGKGPTGFPMEIGISFNPF
ncbi:MAG: outer membrane beta-barrel protein, partial [Chitinophagales bacterium]